jgi:hypothetical protein
MRQICLDCEFSFREDRMCGGNQRGQGLAEYLIITILVAIIVLVGVRYFGGSVTNQFESATGEISGMKKDDDKSGVTPGDPVKDRGGEGSGEGGASADKLAGSSGQSGGNGSSDKSRIDELRPAGVGDSIDGIADSIQIDWRTLGIIGLVACGIGVAVVLFATRDRTKRPKEKKQKKKRFSRTNKPEGGQAIAEFLLVSITFLFVILGLIQMAMVLNAYALVRYAAYNAARAAVVHQADEDKMRDAARISLLPVFPRHGRADHILGFTENYQGALATDNNPVFFTFIMSAEGNFLPVAEPITEVKILPRPGRNTGDVVTFDDPVDFDQALITVQVVHNYEMVVPLVNRILFFVTNLFRSKKLGLGSGYEGQTLERLSTVTDRLRRGADTYANTEYRIPLVAHYTMRMQSDFVAP